MSASLTPAPGRPPAPIIWIALVASLALAPAVSAQTFTSVATALLAGHVSFSTGASWVDVDADGDLDLFVATGFSGNNNNVLYRNDGGDTFVRILGTALVTDAADSPCSTWGDYDNDGDVDGFVSNFFAPGSMLYEGHGAGSHTLNTTAGIGGATLTGAGCAWGDYDNDGHLDLILAVIGGGNRLFHGDGDGTFTEVTAAGVTTSSGNHHHPTWSDHDGDGDLDLFFATGPVGSNGTDQMYRNQKVETGTATFTLITAGTFATDFRDSQVLTWVDYDDDGDLDMYAVNYTSGPNQLYRNDGGGAFTKITTGAIVTDAGAAHGVAWGDFDNDGDQDVYVARDLSQNNRYYRNDGGDVFTSVTTGTFVNDGRSNYGATAGDYDQDGDLDLFLPTARSEAASMLLRNDLDDTNHWIRFRCEGTTSNRSGIGAKVRVLATIGGVPRWQMREVLAGTGYGGHGPLEPHFGLGDATTVDSVRVEWPSGVVQGHAGLAVDNVATLIEGAVSLSAPRGGAAAGLALGCEPNPFRGGTTLFCGLARESEVTLAIYDTSGRRVATLARGRFGPGRHAFALPSSALPRSGVYLARMTAGSETIARRIAHLR